MTENWGRAWSAARIGFGWIVACAGALALATVTAVIGVDSPIVDKPVVFVTLRIVCCVGLVPVAVAVSRAGPAAGWRR